MHKDCYVLSCVVVAVLTKLLVAAVQCSPVTVCQKGMVQFISNMTHDHPLRLFTDPVLYGNESHCDGLNLSQCFNFSYFNYTAFENVTESFQQPFDLFMGIVSIVLGLMILVTIIGNVFVIAAILLERNLQNVANYLIVSLAVADLMVACLVMPLGAVYEIMKGWVLGPELCDMWTSCDVLCCTASILHLVAIATDRYWAVTDLDYIHSRNVNKIGMMIFVVWVVALIVSLAPQFGWKDPAFLDRINSQKRCLVSQDVAYQIFATCSTFYVPLLVILFLYWKIFQTARKRIRRNCKRKPSPDVSNAVHRNLINTQNYLPKKRHFKRGSLRSSATKALVSSLIAVEDQASSADDVRDVNDMSDADSERAEERLEGDGKLLQENTLKVATAYTISELYCVGNPEKKPVVNSIPCETTATEDSNRQRHISDDTKVASLLCDSSERNNYGSADEIISKAGNPMQIQREKKESIEAKRERKAAKTLAIITGAFVICWLPFFIMAILMPVFGPISDHLASFFLWLGYFNSTLNPVIYTIFSPEFRQAFKRILCGTQRRSHPFRHGNFR